MRLGRTLSWLALCACLIANVFGDDSLQSMASPRSRRLLGGEFPQQTLAAVASLANRLASLQSQGGPANPIANSAVQLLGALQAPQSNTYIFNLATSIVQLIGSVASGQSPTPATAALVVQILQDVLNSASPSLVAEVSQGLHGGNILPSALFEPEGNFSSGPDIVQAIIRLLDGATGSLSLSFAPAVAPAVALTSDGMYSLPFDALIAAAPEAVFDPAVSGSSGFPAAFAPSPSQAPSPAPQPASLPSFLAAIFSAPGSTLRGVEGLLAAKLPMLKALRALPAANGNSLQAPIAALLALPDGSLPGPAPGRGPGSAPARSPITTPGEAPQPGMALLTDATHSYPTLAPTSGDTAPFGAPVTTPTHSPDVAPSLSLPYGIGDSLPPIPSLDAVLAGVGIDPSASLTVNLENLIVEAQNDGIEGIVEQLLSTATSYVTATLGNLSNLRSLPWVAGLIETGQALSKLLSIPAILPTKGVGSAALDVIDGCAKGMLELPSKAPPSCSAESFTLTLVPWTCLLDSSNNTLSCSDSFLLYEETPASCTLLNISDGLLAGRQCPAEKSIGPNDDIIFGGQKLELKFAEVLKAFITSAAG